MTAVETAQRNFAYTTVALDCDPVHIKQGYPAKTSEAIYPGMLLGAEQATDGTWMTIKATDLRPVISLAMEKREIGETVHTVYADEENVTALFPHKGEKVLVRVRNGQNISTLDYLVAYGDGTVVVADSNTDADLYLFQAACDCDLTLTDEDDEIALVAAYVL